MYLCVLSCVVRCVLRVCRRLIADRFLCGTVHTVELTAHCTPLQLDGARTNNKLLQQQRNNNSNNTQHSTRIQMYMKRVYTKDVSVSYFGCCGCCWCWLGWVRAKSAPAGCSPSAAHRIEAATRPHTNTTPPRHTHQGTLACRVVRTRLTHLHACWVWRFVLDRSWLRGDSKHQPTHRPTNEKRGRRQRQRIGGTDLITLSISLPLCSSLFVSPLLTHSCVSSAFPCSWSVGSRTRLSLVTPIATHTTTPSHSDAGGHDGRGETEYRHGGYIYDGDVDAGCEWCPCPC